MIEASQPGPERRCVEIQKESRRTSRQLQIRDYLRQMDGMDLLDSRSTPAGPARACGALRFHSQSLSRSASRYGSDREVPCLPSSKTRAVAFCVCSDPGSPKGGNSCARAAQTISSKLPLLTSWSGATTIR